MVDYEIYLNWIWLVYICVCRNQNIGFSRCENLEVGAYPSRRGTHMVGPAQSLSLTTGIGRNPRCHQRLKTSLLVPKRVKGVRKCVIKAEGQGD